MASFRDRNGKEWALSITVASIKRVRDRLGVNLGMILSDNMKPLADLVSDPVKLVDVIYVLCQPECERCGVTDEQFGESLAGDSFEDAVTAFQTALADFFPKRQGDMLRMVLAKGEQMQIALAEKVKATIETEMQKTLTQLASNSQG